MQRNRLELLIFEDLLTRIFSFSFRETETKERVREKKNDYVEGRRLFVYARKKKKGVEWLILTIREVVAASFRPLENE